MEASRSLPRQNILKAFALREADLEAEDKDGKTPFEIASCKGAHQLLINLRAKWRKEDYVLRTHHYEKHVT